MKASSKTNNTGETAGRGMNRFCAESDVSRALVYALPEHLRPHSVKVGRRRIITEAPADWLHRVGRTA